MYISETNASYYQPVTPAKQASSDDIPGSNNKADSLSENSAPAPAYSSPAKTTSQVSAALLAVQEESSSPTTKSVFAMNTNHGNVPVNLDEYFSPKAPSQFVDLNSVPLLMPSADNIQALSQHVSDRFKQLLADYNIPEAPASMTYDREGKMQLPDDYPYANELKQALEENPSVARELSTLNALTSHFVEIQKRVPMNTEMANAKSLAEVERILEKYKDLLQDNATYSNIALTFTKAGEVSLKADGKEVALT